MWLQQFRGHFKWAFQLLEEALQDDNKRYKMAASVLGDEMSLTGVKWTKLTLNGHVINSKSKVAIW